MRDFLLAIIIIASLPIGIFRPFYGALIYAWISYMNPHLLAWSFVRTWPVAKISGISTFIGAMVQQDTDSRPLREPENILMIVLFLIFTLSSAFSIYPNRAWPEWFGMGKIILMALVTSTLLTDRKRLRYFFLVVGFSLGFYGVKGGLFGLATGGQETVWGPGESIIGANNALGVGLNMCLPIFWYLAKEKEPRWLKKVLLACFFLTIPAIMFTYSRASALGLGAVILAIILKGKGKVLALAILLVAGMLTISFVPEKWLHRQQTTLTYEQDTSAMSRLGEWEFCWRLALDRPLTGGGFEFYTVETYAKYFPEFLSKFGTYWNAHSIYFGMLAAHGFPGLLIFSLMLALTLVSLRGIKRAVGGREDLKWLANYSNIVQVSYIGFLVNGAFNNMEYFDLVYHWVGVTASLKVLARQALKEGLVEEPVLTGPMSPLAVRLGSFGGPSMRQGKILRNARQTGNKT